MPLTNTLTHHRGIYSLFIDESGAFGNPGDRHSPWVVGGLLCPHSADLAADALAPQLPSFVHLTDLRREHPVRAAQLSQQFFDSVAAHHPDYRFIAVKRFGAARLADHWDNYRLMLADLLALAESCLDSNVPLKRLELVIAYRTVDGQGTTPRHINTVLDSLFASFDAGLASRGLIELIGGESSERTLTWNVVYSSENPARRALWAADILCNTIQSSFPDPKAQIAAIRNRGQLKLFHSFDGYQLRRAAVAERDCNYGAAVYWYALSTFPAGISETPADAIGDLFLRLDNYGAATDAAAAVEGAIELVWQEFNAQATRSKPDAL